MRLAKRYKGLAVLWEHRFYGASLPFPVNVRRLRHAKLTFRILSQRPTGKHDKLAVAIPHHRASARRRRLLRRPPFSAGLASQSEFDHPSVLAPVYDTVGLDRRVVPGYPRRPPACAQPLDDLCRVGVLRPCAGAGRYGGILQGCRAQPHAQLLRGLGGRDALC